jgi:tRNA-specific 2-thiouridylase
MNKTKEKVLVGFSGGVDSTSVMDILRKKGFEPVAVFLKISEVNDLEKVRQMADKLGVELIVKDISNIFTDCIVKSFLEEYKNNRTPNPCVKCNYEIKFNFLLKIADEMGIEKIATGHYARIEKREGKFFLLKGKDEKKDQSYFLYRLTQKELARIIFPLGDQVKDEIKKTALKKGWFEKIKESQDVCFLGKEQKVQNFLRDNLVEKRNNLAGIIEDDNEKELGRHQGLVYYTQGQRKGLDLPGGPYYVVDKKQKKNVLVVSKNKNHPNLKNQEVYLEQVNWVNGEPDFNKDYQFKSRYRSEFKTGKIVKKGNQWVVNLDQPQWAVAKGQSMVIYDKNKVVGGGVISKVE